MGAVKYMNNKEAVWKLLALLKGYEKSLLIIMGGLFVSSGLNLCIPLLSRQIMDVGFMGGNYGLLVKLVLLTSAIYIVDSIINVMKEKKRVDISTQIQYFLSKQSFKHLMKLKVSYFNNRNYAEIMNNVNVDVHSKKRMSLETAKKAVDFYYNHCKNTKSAQIGFYGGEPLLEIELIKEIVEYSKILFRGKEIIFNMTTNASLLDDDKIDFLATNNFNLTISLDGPENVQNSGRKFAGSLSGTYQVVIDNIAKIEERHPEYIKNISFNAVLGTDSNFLDSSNYFTFDYRPNNLVTAVNVSDKDAIDPIMYSDEFRLNYFYEVFKSYLWGLDRIEEQDVSKLVRSYIKTIKTDIHDRLQLNTIRTIKCHPSGPCLAGVNRLFVTVEGDFFPCERVNETSKAYNIGNLDEGFWYDKSYELLNIGKLTERECRECWAINFCNCCAAGIEEGDKLSRKKRLEKCKSNKHVVEERLKEYCTLREYGCKFED